MNEERLQELQHQVDAILFAAGDKIEVTEIARLCNLGHNLDLVEEILKKLEKKYEHDPTLFLAREGNALKLRIREKYIPVVKNIVTKTELTKSVMETLAIVAYKAPVLQSDIIHIRTNKAYDHLAELESAGYVTRVRKGRTKLIRLTEKFFDYFDIPPDRLKERFSNVAELEQAVGEKEQEVNKILEERKVDQEIKKKEEQAYKENVQEQHKELSGHIEKKEQQVDLDTYDAQEDPHTEVVDEKQPFEGTNIEVVKETLGDLEVVDEPSEEAETNTKEHLQKQTTDDNDEDEEREERNKQDDEDNSKDAENTEEKNSTESNEGLFEHNAPPGFEEQVDERVEEIIHPHEQEQPEEQNQEQQQEETEQKQEPEQADENTGETNDEPTGEENEPQEQKQGE